MRFTRVKNSPAKEVISSAEPVVVKTIEPEQVAVEEAPVVLTIETEETQTEDSNQERVDEIETSTMVSTEAESPESIATEEIDGQYSEDPLSTEAMFIKDLRIKAWRMTLGALLTAIIFGTVFAFYYYAAIGGIALVVAIVGGYIFYGFLCRHLYQVAVDYRIHKYTREEGDTSCDNLFIWNLIHLIIASAFGFFIPLIVLAVKLNRIKRKYKPEKTQ